MKKIALIFASLVYAVSLLPAIALAQEKQPDEWIRVHSNDAEFSIEVPVEYDYFYDENGFLKAERSSSYKLQKMSMLNAYHAKTLLSFERYKAKKGGLEAIYDEDKRFPKEIKTSGFNRNGTAIKQITTNTDEYYCVRQYFHSKSNIYILTVATRNGENATMKRFLDSLIFKPATKEKPEAGSILFSALKATPVNLVTAKKAEDTDKKDETNKSPTDRGKDDTSKLVVVKKPKPTYVDTARMKAIQGTIRLRTTFGENGFIPEIEIIKSLPEGLLRQAIFAALRIKFLPEEKKAKPVSLSKTIEYSFAIY